MEDLNKAMDKLINRFIHEGRKFVDVVAHPYGMIDLIQYGVKSLKLIYDFEYFTFAKSTKTLISIRDLLKIDHNEDVFILARSVFENYLSCRHLQENEEKLDSFITNPLGLAFAHYYLQDNEVSKEKEIVNRQKEYVGKLENPSSFKSGSDKKYFYDYYEFLCTFTHCNFGVMECFVGENGLYTINKTNYSELSRVITIFSYTKIFESVVTVSGEEFMDQRHEERCYQLVRDSIKLQEKVFDLLISRYQADNDEEFYKYRNKKMREMLKGMKKSLFEELGDVKKTEL